MDYAFTYEQRIDGWTVGTFDGVATIQAYHGGTAWRVAGIALDGARVVDRKLERKAVVITPLDGLWKDISRYLETERDDDIAEQLRERGELVPLEDYVSEHRLSHAQMGV